MSQREGLRERERECKKEEREGKKGIENAQNIVREKNNWKTKKKQSNTVKQKGRERVLRGGRERE